MIVSESIAANKKCCIDINKYCISSRCMAWRWEVATVEIPMNSSGYFPRPPKFEHKKTENGYCGRAYK